MMGLIYLSSTLNILKLQGFLPGLFEVENIGLDDGTSLKAYNPEGFIRYDNPYLSPDRFTEKGLESLLLLRGDRHDKTAL